jgi:hypothetical protein
MGGAIFASGAQDFKKTISPALPLRLPNVNSWPDDRTGFYDIVRSIVLLAAWANKLQSHFPVKDRTCGMD